MASKCVFDSLHRRRTPPIEERHGIAGEIAVAGALLGLYQMGSYRKPNQWLNLLHRPMHWPSIVP